MRGKLDRYGRMLRRAARNGAMDAAVLHEGLEEWQSRERQHSLDCVLMERAGKVCVCCEYRRKLPRKSLCTFLGVTIPKAFLREIVS